MIGPPPPLVIGLILIYWYICEVQNSAKTLLIETEDDANAMKTGSGDRNKQFKHAFKGTRFGENKSFWDLGKKLGKTVIDHYMEKK